MDLLTSFGPLLLGLLAWGLGLAAQAGPPRGRGRRPQGVRAPPRLQGVDHKGGQLREGDFAAIEDTWDAFTLCAAVLLAGTLALNGAAWLRGHRKG